LDIFLQCLDSECWSHFDLHKSSPQSSSSFSLLVSLLLVNVHWLCFKRLLRIDELKIKYYNSSNLHCQVASSISSHWQYILIACD
jgi:hypothetical protein